MYVYNNFETPVSFSWSLVKYKSVIISFNSPSKYEIPARQWKFIELWLTSERLLTADEKKDVVRVVAAPLASKTSIKINGEDELNIPIYSAERRLDWKQEAVSLERSTMTDKSALRTTNQHRMISLVISEQGKFLLFFFFF